MGNLLYQSLRVMINALGLECVASPICKYETQLSKYLTRFHMKHLTSINFFFYIQSPKLCVKNNCSNLLNSYEIVTGKKKSLVLK